MRKRSLLRFLAIGLLSFVGLNSFAQLVEAPLSNPQMGVPHYGPDHWSANPELMINDAFVFDPNEITSDLPMVLHSNDDPQIVHILNDETDNDTYKEAGFPGEGDDCWASFNVEIPDGKMLKKLFFWGRNNEGQYYTYERMIVILESDGARWYSPTMRWRDSINHAVAPALMEIDLTQLGVTDNLLLSATKVIITRYPSAAPMMIGEVRMAAGDLPTLPTEAPVLSEVTSGSIFENRDLNFKCDQTGTVYMVPTGTTETITEIQMNNVRKWGVVGDSLYTSYMNSSAIEAGAYKLYALGENNLLSAASPEFTIEEDVTAPVISELTSGEFVENTYLKLKLDERAHIYLVPSGTAKDSTAITEAAKRQFYKGNLEDELILVETYRAGNGVFSIYAIDIEGNISEASADITLTAKETTQLTELVLDSCKIGNFHYADKYNKARYMLNDPFVYNPATPNDPTLSHPDFVGDTTAWHGTISNADPATQYVDCFFTIPDGMQLDVLDIWLRNNAGNNRIHNLAIEIGNEDTTWTSYRWSGANPVESANFPAYGRFEFNVADSMPTGLLRKATYCRIYHAVPDFLGIQEIRFAMKERDNVPPVAVLAAGTDIGGGETIQLDASGSYDADGDPITYTWLSADVTLSDLTIVNPSFVSPMENGTVTIILRVNDGIEDSSPITVTYTVKGVNVEKQMLNAISVYPNPSANGFNVDLSSYNECKVSVSSITGQKVYESINAGGAVYYVPAENFAKKGIYFMTVETDGQRFVEKLVVE